MSRAILTIAQAAPSHVRMLPATRPLLVGLALSLPLAATACDGVQIALREPVASVTPVRIEGGGKVRTLGDVTITKTKGGMVSTTTGKAGPWGGEKVKQKFQYETSDGWAGQCAFASGSQSVGGFDIAANGGLRCTITKADQSWDLDLQAVVDNGKRLIGTYSDGAATINVTMSNDSNLGRGPFMGYVLDDGNVGVAGIQVTGVRSLWLVENSPNADAIRASVGAMLYSESAVRQATGN